MRRRRTLTVVAAIVCCCDLVAGGLGVRPAFGATSTCPYATEQAIIYAARGSTQLQPALKANNSTCINYYISVPVDPADHTKPRADGQAQKIRALGPNFHAMAEFQWQSWINTSGSWYAKGVLFRQRMRDAGYDVGAGDTWEINELPSNARSSATVQTQVQDVVRGLATAGTSSTADDKKGVVFVIGMGQGLANFNVYKPALESWLTSKSFWAGVAPYVMSWSQEAYASCSMTCVKGTNVVNQANHLNDYVMHPAILAAASGHPSTTATAQSYLGRSYVPLQTAVYNSPVYGDNTNQIPLATFMRFLSLQVYASRTYADSHTYPDGRIAFAWYDAPEGLSDADRVMLASHVAAMIVGAYGEGGTPAKACSPTGNLNYCGPTLDGAAFNERWSTMRKW